jgi:uncharacterized membrane protein YraQ (UPF0718 family)
MLAMETKFLGLSFTLLRLVLTLISAVIIGWIVARVTGDRWENQAGETLVPTNNGALPDCYELAPQIPAYSKSGYGSIRILILLFLCGNKTTAANVRYE